MGAVNNLGGHIVKDGKVVYYEQIESNLYFAVVLMYEPFYNGGNSAWHQNSSQLICEAVMTNGQRYTYGNGVIGLVEAEVYETVDDNVKFNPLRDDMKTKDGFRVWQKDYCYREYEKEIDGKRVKLKSRKAIWLVDVPKPDLLRYCKVD